MEVNEKDPVWGMVVWNETYYADEHRGLAKTIGRRREDIFAMPLAFVQIANYEKLLRFLNIRLDTLFDEYEYEDVSYEKLPLMISAINDFILEKKYNTRNPDEKITHCYRLNPDRTPLHFATCTLGEFLDLLYQLCNFLEEAYQKKKDIVVAL